MTKTEDLVARFEDSCFGLAGLQYFRNHEGHAHPASRTAEAARVHRILRRILIMRLDGPAPLPPRDQPGVG